MLRPYVTQLLKSPNIWGPRATRAEQAQSLCRPTDTYKRTAQGVATKKHIGFKRSGTLNATHRVARTAGATAAEQEHHASVNSIYESLESDTQMSCRARSLPEL